LSSVVLGIAVAVLAEPASARRRAPTEFELVLEGGATVPTGDQGDDFYTTNKGLGAETGYTLGLRARSISPSGWAISPAIHYAEFGDFATAVEDGASYEFSTSLIRFGIDVQHVWPGRYGGARPFVSAGAAVYRNHYTDRAIEGSRITQYEADMTGLGVSFGGGLRVGVLEVGVTYHLNRFDTARIASVAPGRELDYAWDYVSLHAGFVLPAGP
jgi:hypothetical protein